jgi:hypothetical protein
LANFSHAPCGAQDLNHAPRSALVSTLATRVPGVHNSGRATRDYGVTALPVALLASPSGCTGATDTTSTSAVATGEGCTSGSSGQCSYDDHTGEVGLPADRHTPSTTSVSTLSLVPSSIYTTPIDLNWPCTMEEEFAALITNNTWDLVPCPIGSNVITDMWIFKHKFNSDASLERYNAH